MKRRAFLGSLAGACCALAGRLPANRNIRWALGANLWNYFPRVPFTDILDVMRDTGFIGIRLTQFPGILKTYGITAAQLQTAVEKRGLSVVTISFNGPTNDESQRKNVLAAAHDAMEFLRDFGAAHLVVFSPRRRLPGSGAQREFRVMCHSFNAIGELAGEMGMKAGLHNHLGQMVQTADEIDRAMQFTDPALFHFSPDTAHVHLAGVDVVPCLKKHQARIMFLDYKDAKRANLAKDFRESIYDLGDGEVDFPGCHRLLKAMNFQAWICVDLDIARNGPRASYVRCGEYIVRTLEPVYA